MAVQRNLGNRSERRFCRNGGLGQASAKDTMPSSPPQRVGKGHEGISGLKNRCNKQKR